MYRLKQRRTAAGLSQAQLSDLSGVPLRTIRAYEAEAETSRQDINRAEALTVYKLAEALSCRAEDLLEGVPPYEAEWLPAAFRSSGPEDLILYECSACHFTGDFNTFRHCPGCGRKMREIYVNL